MQWELSSSVENLENVALAVEFVPLRLFVH